MITLTKNGKTVTAQSINDLLRNEGIEHPISITLAVSKLKAKGYNIVELLDFAESKGFSKKKIIETMLADFK